MEFRRGHRDERRRRVLIDEPDVGQPCATGSQRREAGESPSAEPARRYADAALSPRQPRVIDLIPTRRWTNLVLLMLLLSGAAGIETLYSYLALGHTSLSISQIPAIDLAKRGNVATWFSSAMLATCAVYGLLTYQIRRHRADDYRGRYRMWCWMVPLFLLASVDQVAGVQESVRTALLHVADMPGYQDTVLIWTGAVALITGSVGGRLLVEMRASRLASLLLLISLGCFGAVGAVQVGWLLTGPSVLRTMAVSGLVMGAHIALLMAVFLYARHVHHDARGPEQSKSSGKRKKKVKQSVAERDLADEPESATAESRRSRVRRKSEKVIRTDPPHSSTQRAASTAKSASAGRSAGNDRQTRKEKRRVTAEASTADEPASPSPCQPDDDQAEQPRRLSKSERKRLRKQRRQQRQS